MQAILIPRFGPLIGLLVLFFTVCETLSGQQRGLEPADYYGMVSIGDVKISPDGNLVDDFLFETSEHAIHVLNAPSPAATASLAIADHIVDTFAARAG